MAQVISLSFPLVKQVMSLKTTYKLERPNKRSASNAKRDITASVFSNHVLNAQL